MDLDAAERIAIDAVRTAFAELRRERNPDNLTEIDNCLNPTNETEIDGEPDVWLSEAAAARLIGDRSADRLRKHRDRDTGPTCEVLRRGHVRYRRAEVLKWAASNPRRPDNPDKNGTRCR